MPADQELSKSDRDRFEHMLQAARDAVTILGQLTADAIAEDMVRARALVNCFTEIGEAAAKTTTGARSLIPNIPWRQVVGMRNNLVHVYWGIDFEALARTVRDDLPVLIEGLQQVLGTSANNTEH